MRFASVSRRRTFSPRAGAFLVLLLILISTHTTSARPKRTRGVTTAPDEIHWTVTGADAVTFDWRGGEGKLRYGKTSAYDTTVSVSTPDPVPFSSPGPFWEARLEGLAPGALYHYVIGDGPDRTFRAPPLHGAPGFTLAVQADIGDSVNFPRAGIIQSMIAARRPDLVIAPGDLSYGNAHGQDAVDQHFNDVMVWSPSAAYMPSWGNHEWDLPEADDLRNYKGRFDLPNAAASPGSPAVSCCGEDWYWFDYGNTRFIAYPEPWLGAWADWVGHAREVMDQAQADPLITFIVTFGHRPAYSSGHHLGSARLASYLGQLAANHDKYVLNLNGHSHNYERTFPLDGVVHVTTGNAGASLETDGDATCMWRGGCPTPPWSAARAMHHGFLVLRFTKTAIEGKEICGPPGDGGANGTDVECEQGSVFDAFRIRAQRLDAAPLLSAPPFVEVEAGQRIEVPVEAKDPDGDAIDALEADLSQLPAGGDAAFTVNDSHTNGILGWTPGASDTGTYTVSFRANNTASGTASMTVAVSSANQPPVARLSVQPQAGDAPLDVLADASESFDPDGSIRSYIFDFGDGTRVLSQAGPIAAHTYEAGEWDLTVTAVDDDGAAGSASARVLAHEGNLVGNSSFELSTVGWNEKNGAVLSRTETGRDGAFALAVQGPATLSTFGVNDSPNWVRSVPEAGARYHFTAWVRSGADTGRVELRVREYLGNQLLGGVLRSASIPLSPDWQRLTLDAVASATGSTYDFQIFDRPERPGESFEVDSVSITVLPPESPTGPQPFHPRDPTDR